MSDLIKKVENAIWPGYGMSREAAAGAALAVLLNEQVNRAREALPNDIHIVPFLRAIAHENGVELDARPDRPQTKD